jgi:hypothetical protein
VTRDGTGESHNEDGEEGTRGERQRKAAEEKPKEDDEKAEELACRAKQRETSRAGGGKTESPEDTEEPGKEKENILKSRTTVRDE